MEQRLVQKCQGVLWEHHSVIQCIQYMIFKAHIIGIKIDMVRILSTNPILRRASCSLQVVLPGLHCWFCVKCTFRLQICKPRFALNVQCLPRVRNYQYLESWQAVKYHWNQVWCLCRNIMNAIEACNLIWTVGLGLHGLLIEISCKFQY